MTSSNQYAHARPIEDEALGAPAELVGKRTAEDLWDLWPGSRPRP